MGSHRQVKGAIVFALIFFTAICYLYSLPMETMTVSQIKENITNVWERVVNSDTWESGSKPMLQTMCETMIGWLYNCCGKEWHTNLIRNYTFEIWLVYLLAYLFSCVWFLLEIFETYWNKKELDKLRKERMESLRSERTCEILRAKISMHQQTDSGQATTKISSVVQLSAKTSDCKPIAGQQIEESIFGQLTEDLSASQLNNLSSASFGQMAHKCDLKNKYFQRKSRGNSPMFRSRFEGRRRSESDVIDSVKKQHMLTATCSRTTDLTI